MLHRGDRLHGFGDGNFDETVLVVEECLGINHGTDQFPAQLSPSWDIAKLPILKQLYANAQKVQKECDKEEPCTPSEDWMMPGFSGQNNLFQKRPFEDVTTDVLLAVVSRLGCEENCMSMILEVDDISLMLVEEMCCGLKRWRVMEKAGSFVIKCLNALFDSKIASLSIWKEIQRKLLTTIHEMLLDEALEDKGGFISKLIEIYQKWFCNYILKMNKREAKENRHDPNIVINDSFKFLEGELDKSKSFHLPYEREVKLRKKVIEKRQKVAEIVNKQNTQILKTFTRDYGKANENKHMSYTAKLEEFCVGIRFIDEVTRKLNIFTGFNEGCYTGKYSSLKDWELIVDYARTVNSADDEKAQLLPIKEGDTVMDSLEFLELLDGWEVSALACLETYPNLAVLYGPLICTAGFLISLLKELGNCYPMESMDTQMNQKINHLSSVVFEISNHIDVETANNVIFECLNVFELEGFSLCSTKFTHEQFASQLNLSINKLSHGSTFELLRNLAHLCLVSPFEVLEELCIRAISSAPLSQVVLEFLAILNSLLMLKKPGKINKKVLYILKDNLMELKKKNFEIVAKFIAGIMCIKSKNCEDSEVLGPLEVLENILFPELEKCRLERERLLSAPIFLTIFEETVNMVNTNSATILNDNLLTAITKCTILIVKVSEQFEKNSTYFHAVIDNTEEREQIYKTILNTTQILEVLCPSDTSKHVCNIIVNELQNLGWLSCFYFADFLIKLHPENITFPVPKQVAELCVCFSKLCFQEALTDDYLPKSNLGYWIIIMNISQIHLDISYHFLSQLLSRETFHILDFIIALSITMMKSTRVSWHKVVHLVERCVQNGNSQFFTVLPTINSLLMANSSRLFACKISLILHAFFVVLERFAYSYSHIVYDSMQKIHATFSEIIKQMESSDNEETLIQLKILYFSLSMMLDKRPFVFEVFFDSLMLQLLEVVIEKLDHQSTSELDFWNNKLTTLKHRIAEEDAMFDILK